MPLYRCAIRAGLSDEAKRARIAKEVVRVHCGVTGAPASFVHAFFSELPPEALPEGRQVVILGSIRAGRSEEQRQRITSELGASAADALGCDAEQVQVLTVELPARWVMEGGAVLPEPGEEAEWLARHQR